MAEIKAKTGSGLRGIVAAQTKICSNGDNHDNLYYRGYSIYDLAANCEFEEVAHLLLKGNLPNKTELANFKKEIIAARGLPKELKDVLKLIPKDAHPMDVMRTGCSFLGTLEPEKMNVSKKDFSDEMRVGIRLLGIFPSIMLFWHHWHNSKKEMDTNSDQDTIAGYYLEKLHDKAPSDLWIKSMHVSLILYAEHDLNASTFTSRVISATFSDVYSAITGSIGALRGPLHGGANEAAMDLITEFDTPQKAVDGVKAKLAAKTLIFGFGHGVYTTHDPRNVVIKGVSQKLSQDTGDSKGLFKISEAIESLMWEEKKLFPNLDFFSASAYHFMGIPTGHFTPIFIMSRVTGWLAHIFEQRANNRLIRPSSEYVGDDVKKFVPINER